MQAFITENYNASIGFTPGSLGAFVNIDITVPNLGPSHNAHNFRVTFALHQIWDQATDQYVYELRSFFPQTWPGTLAHFQW